MNKMNILQIINLTVQEIKLKPLEFIRFGIPLLFIPLTNFILYKTYGSSISQSYLPIIVPYIIYSIVLAIVLVGCHRTYLMNDIDIKQTKTFRFGIREWNFLAWWIKIGLIIIAFVVLISMFMKAVFQNYNFIDNFLFIPIIYIISRISLVFPATAVKNKNTSILEAWNLSKNHGMSLFLLIGFIPWLLELIFEMLPYYDSILYNILSRLIWLIVGVFEVGLLSMSYAYLSGYIDDDPSIS